MNSIRKFLAILLSLALLCASLPALSDEPPAAEAGASTPATDTPTPATDTPAPPSNTPTPPATDTPAPGADTPAPSADPSTSPSVGPSESPDPSTSPSVGPSESPDPSASPSVGPSESPDPNASPSIDPSESPSLEPSETPEAPVWDESLCNHTTADCLLAPKCEVPGCLHITTDVHGLPIPCCALGEWLLAQNDTPPQTGGKLLRATAPVRVDLSAGNLNIYRSGTYIVQGGNANATITVQPNRVVSFQLKGVTAQSLTLLSGATTNVAFTGSESTLGTLSVSGGSATLLGGGSLVCGAVSGSVRMEGGSVNAPAGSSANGRRLYVFATSGTTSATVDGAAVSGYAKPNADGNAYLWLGDPPAGSAYTAADNGTELVVTSQLPQPATPTDFDLAGSASFAPVKNTAYRLYASGTAPMRTLDVSAPGVTLTLDAPDAPAVALTGAQPYRLHLSGASALALVQTSGALTVSGGGSLTVGTLDAASLAISGGNALCFGSAGGGWLSGLQALALPGGVSAAMRATLDGQPVPLIFSYADPATVYLPVPPAGMRYQAEPTASGPVLTTVAVGAQDPTILTVSDSPLHITQSGAYVLRGQEGTAYAGALTIDGGVTATIALEHVELNASAAVSLGAGANVTLTTRAGGRANAWRGPCTVGSGAVWTVQGDGALMLGSLDASGATLAFHSNVTLGTGSAAGGLVATAVAVTDSAGAALANTAITLKLGDSAPFAAYTDQDGKVFVWGGSALTGLDAVVLSSEGTTATILGSGTAAPSDLPVISAIWSTTSGSVLCTVDNVQPEWTVGLQYLLGTGARDMPDAYVSGAGFVGLTNGEFLIPNLQPGQWVTCRAYASKTPGAVLSAETQDAFQFSDRLAFQAPGQPLPPFALPEQSKTFDGDRFRLDPSLLPKGATVAYLRDGKPLSAAPVDVGVYVIRTTIPAGSTVYQPGAYDSLLRIKKRIVYILPESYGKYVGEDDPDDGQFLFTYEPELLDGDWIDGYLTREPGEDPGNYPYDISPLIAPDYYDLRLSPSAGVFGIAEAPHEGGPYDPLARIDPVHRIIRLSTGLKLDLIIKTTEKLNIGKQGYGSLVTDTETGEPRPFTPDLTLRQGVDEVLLTLEAEPELRADGGYETDFYGNPLLRSRTLTLSFFQLSKLTEQNITHVLFRLDDTAVLLAVGELAGPELRDYVKSQGLGLSGGQVQAVLTPVSLADALLPGEESAGELVALGVRLMRARVEYVQGEQRLDLTPYLAQAALLKDASPLLAEETAAPSATTEQQISGDLPVRSAEEILAEQRALNRTATERIALQGDALARYAAAMELRPSALVVPYAESEPLHARYIAMLRAAPYLTCALTENGLYGFGRLATAGAGE